MRVYAASGRRQQALAQYQLLRQQLDAELAAEPDPETRSLYRELLAPEPATDARSNLPHPLTSFVGRERERAEILRLLERVRLLTLIGPGGCGKTRLAIETLAGVEAVPDGIWFVELAGLADAVAGRPGHGAGRRRPASRRIAPRRRRWPRTWRRARRCIVLDNCEHVIDACARLADGPAARRAGRARRGHEPRAAALRRRGRLARPVAGRGGPAVPRARSRGRPGLHRPTEQDEAPIAGDLPAPRRDAAGHRTGGGARAPRSRSIRSRRAWATASTCSPPAADGAAPASRRCAPRIDWSHDLLDRRGARALPAPGDVRRRLDAGGGRGRLRRRRDRAPSDRRPHGAAGRQVARQRRPAGASACSTPSASTRPSAWTPPPSTTRWRCATSTGAWPWPSSTTRCPPARAARCARWRPSTTTCARP